jgi:hypothetical protein
VAPSIARPRRPDRREEREELAKGSVIGAKA